jgi:hypothetical protein
MSTEARMCVNFDAESVFRERWVRMSIADRKRIFPTAWDNMNKAFEIYDRLPYHDWTGWEKMISDIRKAIGEPE